MILKEKKKKYQPITKIRLCAIKTRLVPETDTMKIHPQDKPVESSVPQFGNINIRILDLGHSRETVGNVRPNDIEVVGDWMLDRWDEGVFLFAWDAEFLKVGFGGREFDVCGCHGGERFCELERGGERWAM